MGECDGGKALDDLRLERPVLLLYAAADLGLAREPWQMGPMTQSMPVFLGMSHGDCLGTSVKDLFSTRMLKIIRPTVVRIFQVFWHATVRILSSSVGTIPRRFARNEVSTHVEKWY